MNPNTQQLTAKGDPAVWLLFALALIPFLTAISSQSLWIDEAVTAWQASAPDLKTCWRQQIEERGSELQMPLFMVYLWAWEKVSGTNEWLLRLGNLPWFLLGFVAWLKATSSNKSLRRGVVLATAFSPFVWFYLNEARPYAMQLGGSFLVFAALFRLGSRSPSSTPSDRLWSIGLACGIFIVCASNMLGVLWVATALSSAVIIMGPKRAWNLLKSFPLVWLFSLIILILLGAYYLWTFKQGARASGAAGTDLKNILFIGYELLGFTGIGPGRLELRESGVESLRPYLPVLAIYAIVFLFLFAAAWRDRNWLAAQPKLFWTALCLILAVVILLAMGHFAHFRVLGRHLTPLMLPVLVWFGFGISRLISRHGIFSKVLLSLFAGLNLYSCVSLRFADRHEKDDYRSAAKIAKAELAAGKSVLWNADKSGALFYGVPISGELLPEKVWLVRNPGFDQIAEAPDIVIASKRDIYDRQNALRSFLEVGKYTVITNFPAFVIWGK